jgi:hypothetical protein
VYIDIDKGAPGDVFRNPLILQGVPFFPKRYNVEKMYGHIRSNDYMFYVYKGARFQNQGCFQNVIIWSYIVGVSNFHRGTPRKELEVFSECPASGAGVAAELDAGVAGDVFGAGPALGV